MNKYLDISMDNSQIVIEKIKQIDREMNNWIAGEMDNGEIDG